MTAPQQQKLKVKGPVVITGNRLGDGAVVYRTANRGWSTSLRDALVTASADEATAHFEGGQCQRPRGGQCLCGAGHSRRTRDQAG